MSIAIDVMRQIGVSCWRPRPPQKLSEWCEKSIRLSRDTEATPGRYDLSENPFWREIIDAFKDPEVRQISIKKSTQVGGTLLLIAVAWAISEFDPAPAMVVGPDELYCNELKDRIYSNGEQSPAVRHRVPPERLRNNRHVDLGTYRAYLAWAGSAQRLRGRPCKRVFRSEIDVYPKQTPKGGDPLKATRERVKRFFDHTIYDESSPDGENSAIDQLYEAGHRARWMCKCPHCGTRQEVRFFVFKSGPRAGNGGLAGYKDADGNFLQPDQVKDAHYRCMEGCRIDQDEKKAFILSGVWVAEGQTVDADGNVIGDPTRGRRHLSFHVWSAHSPTITFENICVAYLEHRRDSKLREFWQNWLGLKYESRKKLPDWHILGERLSTSHVRGTIPELAWFLTAGVDVQLDGCWYTIRAWGDGATSWLVDWGHLRRYDTDDIDVENMTPEELNQFFRSDIAQVRDAVLNRYFPIFGGGANVAGRTRLRPRIVMMDSNYRTREVHAFVSQQDERRMRACRGDHKTKPSERFRVTEVEKPQRDGPSYATPRKVTQIYTAHFKEAIQEKLAMPSPETPGSFNFFANVVQSSSDYLRQLTNESPIEVLDKTTGRKKTVWKPRSEQWGNHCGDTEVYGFCGAEIVLHEMGATWDAQTWVAKANEQRTPTERFDLPSVAVRDYQ